MGKKHYYANCYGKYWSAYGREYHEPHSWSKEYSTLEKAQEAADSHANNNEGHRTGTQVVEEPDDEKLSSNESSSEGETVASNESDSSTSEPDSSVASEPDSSVASTEPDSSGSETGSEPREENA